MNILVVGSGGREHAIALAVKKSPLCDTLVCAPGNPGMANLGKCVPVDVADPKAIADLAVAEKIDLAVIGPEIPLVAGVVDEFRRRGLRAFGPTAAAAALEGSKAFSKDIMKKYNVPTAAFEIFTDLASAKKFLAEHPAPIVVKASGLAAGKGAIVCMTDKEANDAVEEMLGDKAVFGESGKTVVIEEFMDGEEASIFVVCDGKDYVILSSAQDHKRVFLQPGSGGDRRSPRRSEEDDYRTDPQGHGRRRQALHGRALRGHHGDCEGPEGRGIQLPPRRPRMPDCASAL